MNIGKNTHIEGIEKTKCKVEHINHCLNARGMHEVVRTDYFGPRVQRGTVLLHTKNGDFSAKFVCENGWLQSLVF